MDRTVHERVRAILTRQFGLESGEVAPEASLFDDLGADSLDLVELTMAFEDHFGIEVPDGEVESLRTVADIERYIRVHAALPA